MRTVALGEVAAFVRGVTYKPADVSDSGVGIMRTKNVQQELDDVDVLRVPERLVKREEQYLRHGDTLVSSANSWALVGKACWVPELSEPLAVGGFVTALRPTSSAVDERYLYHWFTSPRTQALVRSYSNSTTNISNLNLQRASAMPFPLPSVDEQRRVASVLDRAGVLREKRRKLLEKFEGLRHSIFRSIVGSDYWRAVTASPQDGLGQRWTLLADVADLATGHTPDRNRPEYWDGDIPWISLPDIRLLDGRQAFETHARISSAGIAHSSAVILPAGTVCFSRTASVGFVTKMARPMATSQDFHNWVPGGRLDPDYLMAALRCSRDHLLNASDGSTHKTIYQRTAQRFRILLPSLEDQRSFAVSSARIEAEAVKGLKALGREDELHASLQVKAFRGEL